MASLGFAIGHWQGEADGMPEHLLVAVRCECGGRLRGETEETERGRRWVHVCAGCGRRWGLRDGVFGPLDDEANPQPGGGSAEELAWLACFRRLPGELRAAVLSHVEALARLAGDAP